MLNSVDKRSKEPNLGFHSNVPSSHLALKIQVSLTVNRGGVAPSGDAATPLANVLPETNARDHPDSREWVLDHLAMSDVHR